MNNYDDSYYEFDIYSNSYIVRPNYLEHDAIESIDIASEIFDEYEEEFLEEEGQRMSIEAINFTQQIINGEMEDQEPTDHEIISSYLTNSDEFIETCSICLDDISNIESTSKLSCGHHFHTNCIRLCLERNNKCPLCRKNCMRNI